MFTKTIEDATRKAIRESINSVVNPILQDMAFIFDEKMSEALSPDVTNRTAFEDKAAAKVIEELYNKYRHLSTKYRNLQIHEAVLYIDEE